MSGELLESLVKDLGGCGRYQWLNAFIAQAGKSICALSMLAMTFNGQQPDFRCMEKSSVAGSTLTGPRVNGSANLSTTFDNQCWQDDMFHCQDFQFADDINTIVNEWQLVCDRKWIVAIITTIQMIGVLVGCFISGHLGDIIGRKPTFFVSLVILVVFNIVAYFSVNWEMYAVIRFILGLGIGCYLTVHFNVALEFVPIDWRARIVSVPAWACAGGLFALLAYVLKDWKHLHLATAATGVPFLMTYCFVQESIRWLVTKGRYRDVDHVINNIASTNRKPAPDSSQIIEEARANLTSAETKHYTVIDLFRTRERTTVTLGLLFIWMSISYSYYGLTFGVNSLSGNLYLNMFLMNMIEVPASFSNMYLVNRFGRKKCCIWFFACTSVFGLIVGVIQYVDTPYRGAITNAFALASKMGIALGWGCLIIYTSELYPTVVRTISYGLHNTSARIGSIVAPQVVFLNESIPGLMYFTSCGLLLISSLTCLLFKDTTDKALEDTYDEQAIDARTTHDTKSETQQTQHL